DYDRQPIPFALLRDAEGRTTTLQKLAEERPQLLVFLSSGCAPCHDIASRLLDWSARLGPGEIQTVFPEPLTDLPDAVLPQGITAWHDVERGATDTFTKSRPAA